MNQHILKLTDTLTRSKRTFAPLEPDNIRMYVCGINPYEHSHMGHARGYVVYDVLYRLLRHVYGENHVTYVRNFTDVEDNIIEKANAAGEHFLPFTQKYIASFHEDLAALNCLPPTHEPKVSETMPEIVSMVEKLVANGTAYVTPSGDVNYDVSKAPCRDDYCYGQLSGKKMDELQAGARVEQDPDKRNPGDFALWKAAKPNEPTWPSPWGEGRPGWHIECSAMSEKFLGKHFDIHSGGEDLQFPHHENEIAQSEAANGCKYVNYWLHHAFITVGGRKMSKSLGNFTTIKDALKSHSAEAIRLWLLQTHYRSPVDYSNEALEAAGAVVRKFSWSALLSGAYKRVDEAISDDVKLFVDETWKGFIEALLDDLNTSVALSHMLNMTSRYNSYWGGTKTNSEMYYIQKYLLKMISILGLVPSDAAARAISPEEAEEEKAKILKLKIQTSYGVFSEADIPIEYKPLLQARAKARTEKNFAESDKLRDQLKEMGILVEDGPTGQTWRRT